MSHYSYFNQKIAKAVKAYGYTGEGRAAFVALKREVIDKIVLRRTKTERAEDVKLPSLTVLIRRDPLSKEEQDFYDSLYKQSKVQFDSYVVKGTILHNFAHVFDLLSRLRQAVDHPYLIVHGSLSSAQGNGVALIPSRSRGNLDTCSICLEDIQKVDQISSKCHHHFHRFCLKEYLQAVPPDMPAGCPSCYVALTINLAQLVAAEEGATDADESEALSTETAGLSRSESAVGDASASSGVESGGASSGGTVLGRRGMMSRIKVSEFRSSTKIECLMDELGRILKEDPTSKSIVFSQFTNMLELIEYRVKRGGINCVMLNGSMTLEARNNILQAFIENPAISVICITSKAGGEGLNLQVANNIFLMDPWWNPASEMQAIQRAHRIGQTKPVRAVRIIAKNTIEERILQLQEKKQLMFDGTLGSSNQALKQLSGDDLKFLFA